MKDREMKNQEMKKCEAEKQGMIWAYVADSSPLYDKSRFQKAYENVSQARREKIDRLRLQSDKIRSLGAECLLQQCLRQHGILSYQVEYEKNGKPYLKNCVYREEEKELYFNLSHSGQRVMCAISDMEVGCDVELIKDMKLNMVQRLCTPEEYERIHALQTKAQQNEMFFRIWTLKESFVKATGRGMTQPPKQICIDLENGNAGFHFWEYDLADGYRYAVCGRAESSVLLKCQELCKFDLPCKLE